MKKKNSFVQKIAICTVLGTTALNLTAPKSEALVGVALLNVPVIITGGGMVLGGFLGVDVIFNSLNDGLVLSFLSILAGIVVLDDQNHITPHFKALTRDSAMSMNVSENEMNAFNQELGQINAINDSISSETNAYNTAGTSLNQVGAFVGNKWDAYRPMLSSDAASALVKVQANFRNTVAQATATVRN